MLRIILFVWACYAFTSTTLSQGISYQADELADPEAAVNYALQHIDLSPVSSQLLLDRTLPLGRIEEYGAINGVETVHYHPVVVSLATTTSLKSDKGTSGSRGEDLMLECDPAMLLAGLCDEVQDPETGETIIFNIDLACGEDITDLRKPFIILDGIDLTWTENSFDFGELLDDGDRGLAYFDPAIFPDFVDADGNVGPATLGEILEAAGYDVIFVDYFDHHIRIQDNAGAVEELIRNINTQLQANGSDEPIRMMVITMHLQILMQLQLHQKAEATMDRFIPIPLTLRDQEDLDSLLHRHLMVQCHLALRSY